MPRILAERKGFEPLDSFPSTVFKTAAFDRSAISPNNIKFIVQTASVRDILSANRKPNGLTQLRLKANNCCSVAALLTRPPHSTALPSLLVAINFTHSRFKFLQSTSSLSDSSIILTNKDTVVKRYWEYL